MTPPQAAPWLAWFLRDSYRVSGPLGGKGRSALDGLDVTVPQPGRPAVHLVGAPDGDTPEPDPRPAVELGTDMHRVVDEAIAAWTPNDADVFTRGGELVTVVSAGGRAALTAKTPRVHTLPLAGIANRLSRHVRFVQRVQRENAEGKKWWTKETVKPPARVTAELVARGEWPGLRDLVGVTETPTLRPDGTVSQEPGYDPATGYLFTPGETFPQVPLEPTQDDARRALAELVEPFCDFKFTNPAHAHVPIAAILTMLARPAIRGAVPCFALDAATRGTGKSLLADAIAVVTTGRSASRATFPEDDVELEKVLSSYALSGVRLVLLDNVVRRFGGGPLDKALTARDDVDLRILGRSEMVRIAWSAVVMCSGNNLTFGEDTLRRSLLCRQESDDESPELRGGFRYDPLVDHLARERRRLVVAGLTLLRAWTCKGLAPCAGPWGSFEAWASLVPSAILFAGGPNILEARPTPDRAGDDTIAALSRVLDRLPALSPDPVTARRICDALYPPPREDEPPDGHDHLRDAFDSLGATGRGKAYPTPRALTAVLTKALGRVVGGRRLRANLDRKDVTVFWVEAVRK